MVLHDTAPGATLRLFVTFGETGGSVPLEG